MTWNTPANHHILTDEVSDMTIYTQNLHSILHNMINSTKYNWKAERRQDFFVGRFNDINIDLDNLVRNIKFLENQAIIIRQLIVGLASEPKYVYNFCRTFGLCDDLNDDDERTNRNNYYGEKSKNDFKINNELRIRLDLDQVAFSRIKKIAKQLMEIREIKKENEELKKDKELLAFHKKRKEIDNKR